MCPFNPVACAADTKLILQGISAMNLQITRLYRSGTHNGIVYGDICPFGFAPVGIEP